jgi:hypothetical protein
MGWRWLDIRGLANDLLQRRNAWVTDGAAIDRIVYCTARIDGATNPDGQKWQDAYLKAILTSGSVDYIEYGHYVDRVKRAPLATPDKLTGKAVLAHPQWPVMIQDATGGHVTGARFIVSHAHREEKGSDVNVAAHLLLDVLRGDVEAAIVMSNDSDLRFPMQEARGRVPVGTVNPHRRQLAGALRGLPTDGVGGHWWVQLQSGDFNNHQLPDPCGIYTKPPDW